MRIDELEQIISDALNIPCISEDNAVFDGSFNTEPWMSSAFNGNGEPLLITDHVSINLFYADKKDAIDSVHELLPILSHNKVVASTPDYTRQEQAQLWMATINVNY